MFKSFSMPICRQDTWMQFALAGVLVFTLVIASQPAPAGEAEQEQIIPEGVSKVPYDPDVFRSDPQYEDAPYDAEAQIEIYGGKTKFDAPRVPIELGREIYTAGPFQKPSTILGEKNPLAPHFYVYGDFQNVLAFSDNGNVEIGQFAVRANLDFDLGITSTERIHWFIRPLDRGGQFTTFQFAGDDEGGFDTAFNLNLESPFFEGDLGAIAGTGCTAFATVIATSRASGSRSAASSRPGLGKRSARSAGLAGDEECDHAHIHVRAHDGRFTRSDCRAFFSNVILVETFRNIGSVAHDAA